MSSNKFIITYSSGLGSHVEVCDAQSIEEFANRHFGSVDYKEHGITVEMEPLETPAADAFNGIPVPNATSPLEGDDQPQPDQEDDEADDQ